MLRPIPVFVFFDVDVKQGAVFRGRGKTGAGFRWRRKTSSGFSGRGVIKLFSCLGEEVDGWLPLTRSHGTIADGALRQSVSSDLRNLLAGPVAEPKSKPSTSEQEDNMFCSYLWQTREYMGPVMSYMGSVMLPGGCHAAPDRSRVVLYAVL